MSNDVWILFGKALAVGLLIAAPVGPIGLLTIKRTLDQGRLAGLATGLGAACADAVMAWRTATQAVATEAAALPSRSDLLRCFAGTFVLTLSNPATIVSFIAVFAAMAGGGPQRLSAAPMVAGVWLGSALWWLGLTAVVGRWRHHFSTVWRRRINILSGGLLAGFALWQWAGVLGRLQ